MIVADASLVIAWLLDEPQHAPANAVFDQLAREPLLVLPTGQPRLPIAFAEPVVWAAFELMKLSL